MAGSPNGRPGAVVIGGHANGTGVVRALGRHGISVDVVLTLASDIAHRSRFVRRHHLLLEITKNPDALVGLLEAHATEWEGWVIVPTNDFALTALAKNHERLSQTFRLAAPPWSIVERVIDKRLTAGFARNVGIDVPESYGRAARDFTPAKPLRYPVLVKPTQGHEFYRHFKTKLFMVENEQTLLQVVGQVVDAGFDCDILQYVPGPDTATQAFQAYVGTDGTAHGVFKYRKLRQDPPLFGVACAGETCEPQNLDEPSLALLRAIGWHGVASIGYKTDPRDGRVYLMEINGRSPLSHGLALRAGLNYALMAYSELVDGKISGDEPNGWSGVWIHLHADVFTALQNFGHGEFTWRKILASYRRPKTFAVWAVDDPMPFVTQWGRTFSNGLVRRLPTLRRNDGDNRRLPTLPPRTP